MEHQGVILWNRSIVSAVEKADRRWAGTRGQKSQMSQLRIVLATLRDHFGHTDFKLDGITVEVVHKCVDRWRDLGSSPSTIQSRLSVLSVMGVNTDGCWVRNKLPPKWWLRPEECDRLLPYLRQPTEPFANARLLADYVELVSHTGLRVEEALRLTWRDITLRFVTTPEGIVKSKSEMTVPGTKTERSRGTIAIATEPALLLARMEKEKKDSNTLCVFPIGSYENLHNAWNKARRFLGERGNRMATLRAMRRTAARHLTVNGMPTEMVRKYLRHSNMQTTLGYLNLVGGYTTEEQHRWLS